MTATDRGAERLSVTAIDRGGERLSAPSARGSDPGRRTVTITGRGAERGPQTPRRRPTARRHERPGFQPDRIALYAVLLGVLLVLVAATSSHAAVRSVNRAASLHLSVAAHRSPTGPYGSPSRS